MFRIVSILGLSALLLPVASVAGAATGAAPHAEGAALGLIWIAPFVGILLSIALMPLLAPHLWHRHYAKIALAKALAFLLPFAAVFGPAVALYETLHSILLDYVPFIILLLALFTVAGGIRIVGHPYGTPLVNTAFLAIGTAIASVMGTTGAAMLLIRPLIEANAWRQRKVHIVVVFIFLVANIGGSLTPLGDPPLFLGFLQGVPVFWPTTHMILPMALVTGLLSSFLDNAPTYLVFFNTAGGDAAALTGPLASTLAAISAGAVFMGANSYIGNAPNFMVRAIAENRGIAMPSFFAYMAWSGAILLPLFLLTTLVFFL